MGQGLKSMTMFASCLALCAPGAAKAQMQSVGSNDASTDRPLVVLSSAAYLGHPARAGETPHRQWHVGLGTETRSIQVYVEGHPALEGATREQISRVVDEWNAVQGSPLRFYVTSNAESSQVRVRWINKFARDVAGLTEIETDPAGRIMRATVTLAVHHHNGLPMGPEFVRMVGLHEFGHVVGLPHSEHPRDVMHPGNRNLRLSPRDVATTRQLYGIQP